jgi:hypothetical protein
MCRELRWIYELECSGIIHDSLLYLHVETNQSITNSFRIIEHVYRADFNGRTHLI